MLWKKNYHVILSMNKYSFLQFMKTWQNRLVVVGFMATTRNRTGHPLVITCTSPTNSKQSQQSKRTTAICTKKGCELLDNPQNKCTNHAIVSRKISANYKYTDVCIILSFAKKSWVNVERQLTTNFFNCMAIECW